MKPWLWPGLLVALGMLASGPPGAEAAPARRVLLVSIDGLRPDLMLRADTPTLHELMRQGSFSLWARTTALAVTLPSHTSMLTGVHPGKHGIDWNHDMPFATPVYPKVPTLFELAKRSGLTTAMAAGKMKFQALARPGSLDWCFVPSRTVITDDAVTDTAVAMIERHQPQVMFVHLPGVDTAGHAQGWASSTQMAAIGGADRCVRRLLAALKAHGGMEGTMVLVTSDHGGAGLDHGPDDPRSRTIPWIMTGPGVRRGQDLTQYADLEINTEDTFATICWRMGIPVPGPIDGRPVTAAVDTAVAVSRP